MDSALSLLGLALRAGRLEAGEAAAGEACRAMRCRLLLTAAGVGESTQRRAERWAEEGKCLLVALPHTKEALGAAGGRSACALAAVTDLGLARAVVDRLAGENPAEYAGAAERLRVKAERAAQRREKKNAGETRRDRPVRGPVQYNRKRNKK